MLPSAFAIIGKSWSFYRKQPVLNYVLLWLLMIPVILSMFMGTPLENESTVSDLFTGYLSMNQPSTIVVMLLLNLGITLWIMWGVACILLVGKRIVKSPAGRSRSSFPLVRKQGTKLILPLFLTDILRDIITLFWLLPALCGLLLFELILKDSLHSFAALVIIIALTFPAISYRVRTALYPAVLISEKKEYRDALRRSQELTMGITLPILWRLIGISISLFIIPVGIMIAIAELADVFGDQLTVLSLAVGGLFLAISLLFYYLSIVTLYGAVKKN